MPVPYVLTRESLKTTTMAIQRGLLLREFLVITVIRTLMICLTPQQLLYLNKPTGQAYQAWIEKEAKIRKLSPVLDTVVLADGVTKLHWVKKDRASNVVLFFHGGGYSIPLSPGHLNWCSSIIQACESIEKTTAIAVLEYDLAPEHKYPRQLQQAIFAMDYLLQLGYQPGNVFLGGDSAGGHLALSLLSHMMHSHPSLQCLKLASPLAGVFLISPWLTDDASTLSYKQNACVDMLPLNAASTAADYLIPSYVLRAELENSQGWAMPLYANDTWWQTLADVVSNIYITAGEFEMFRDHIVKFAEILRMQAPSCLITLEVGASEAHDHMLTWEIIRYDHNPALSRLTEWFTSVLHG